VIRVVLRDVRQKAIEAGQLIPAAGKVR